MAALQGRPGPRHERPAADDGWHASIDGRVEDPIAGIVRSTTAYKQGKPTTRSRHTGRHRHTPHEPPLDHQQDRRSPGGVRHYATVDHHGRAWHAGFIAHTLTQRSYPENGERRAAGPSMEEHTRQICGSDRRHLADCRHTLGLRGVRRRQGSAATLRLIDRPGCRALRGGSARHRHRHRHRVRKEVSPP